MVILQFLDISIDTQSYVHGVCNMEIGGVGVNINAWIAQIVEIVT